MKTLFQKILDGEIPSKIVYKDDVCAAINDVNPQAPVHVLPCKAHSKDFGSVGRRCANTFAPDADCAENSRTMRAKGRF